MNRSGHFWQSQQQQSIDKIREVEMYSPTSAFKSVLTEVAE